MNEQPEEFECDYCNETHMMTMTEMQLHLAEQFMAALTERQP